MTDIVCPLGTGSRWNNLELIFALRSIEKHLSDVGDLFIIGEHVKELVDAHQLSFPDLTAMKEPNIYWKIRHACECSLISDPFLLINDDHYIMKDSNAYTFPNYYWKDLEFYLAKRSIQDSYWHAINNTLHALKVYQKPTLYYDIHTPLVIHKKWFLRVMDSFNWEHVTHGYVIKSLYMNMWDVPGSLRTPVESFESADCKTSYPPSAIENWPVISSGAAHHTKSQWITFLRKTFPEKSRWEGPLIKIPAGRQQGMK